MAKTLDAAGVKRLIQEIKGANKNLNTPIPISTENTPESMAQNVKNIADYVEKAKAAGIEDVDGMAVTCLIDAYLSGVGCILGNTDVGIQGIKIADGLVYNVIFSIQNGEYSEKTVIVGSSEEVNSDMLDEGARKPIILTPDTTEVDEETYQKLLSDDVDVVFKPDAGQEICILTVKYESYSTRDFYFTCFYCEGDTVEDIYISAYEVDIAKTTPHTCTIKTIYNDITFNQLTINAAEINGVVNKSTLSPVLQEIDLTGTDAERKAKLDQFEADWKALTGASDLTGARFVGKITTPKGGYASVLFTYNIDIDTFTGVTNLDDSDYRNHYSVYLNSQGVLAITPLFSHLEAITIKTGNTPEYKAANVAAIKAYVDNLTALGVDVTKGYMIPICFSDTELGYVMYHPFSTGSKYTGIVTGPGGASSNVAIGKDGYAYVTTHIQPVESSSLTTTAKSIVPAINEVNANAVHSDKLVPTLEAITIKTNNSPESKEANVAAIKAYVDNLKALGVDVTKGYMIPFGKYNSIGYGILVGSGENPRLQGYMNSDYTTEAIFINPDGTVNEISLQSRSDAGLKTKSKIINSAINEVLTLANAVQAFGAIELKASDNAANKAAVTAYLKILTDAQVDTTNGYSVPVRITGNSQEYHGMLNIGTGVLLSGVVTDVNENHHYPFNVSTTDGAILFDENNYFLEKTSNEVTEMLDAIKYSYTAVPFTDTTLSNKAQLEVFLSKVPNATVMHCTYKEIWAGTLHKINGDWYGLLVKNTNNPADNINIKLSADGTITEGNSAQ